MKSLLILVVQLSIISGECPHPNFVENHVCQYCRDWKEVGGGRRWKEVEGGGRCVDVLTGKVLEHQVSAGAQGVTAVLGPPVYSFPPLFRQAGPASK